MTAVRCLHLLLIPYNLRTEPLEWIAHRPFRTDELRLLYLNVLAVSSRLPPTGRVQLVLNQGGRKMPGKRM